MPDREYTNRTGLAQVIAALLLTAAGASLSFAQTLPSLTDVIVGPAKAEPTEPASPADPAAEMASKRAENAELLRVAQRRQEAGVPTDNTSAQEVATYKTIEAVLAQQEAVDRQIEELRARQADLETQLRSARTASRPAALSIVDFDRLKDELAAEEARVNQAADRLLAAKSALETAQKAQTKSESKRRQAEESFAANKDGAGSADASTAFELARQAGKLAIETVTLRAKEVKRGEISADVQRLAVELKQTQVQHASAQVVFLKADLQDQFSQIDKQEQSANAALATAQTQRQSAEERLREAQKKELEAADGDQVALAEELATLRREQERWSNEVDLVTQNLQRLAQLRLAWNHRFEIATAAAGGDHPPASANLKTWRKETQATLNELTSEASLRTQRMAELNNDLATVAVRAEAAKDGAAAVLSSINLQRTHLEEMLRSQQASLLQIESSRRVYLKLLEELGDNTLLPSKLAAGALEQVNDLLNADIKLGEGTAAKYITVKRGVTGLAVFIVGWMLSRLLSRVFANRFLRRLHLSKDVDAALRSMVYYSMLLIVVLVALNTIRVPLTAFTILGGALAIGVGFGSQALITNFIGGLIMLAERPIRLGEFISIGKFEGVVEEVGFRSTKLRTATDHLVTIPNSTLVSDAIENVARRRTIRRLLNLTVNYDTPRDKLRAAVNAIREILNEKDVRERIHPIVGFEELPPRVFFNDLNAASYNIQVVYWYAPPDWWDYMEHCERINFRIMEEFERLGVEFAFPSNTLHVINNPPPEIEKVPGSRKSSASPADRRHVA